MNSYCSSVESDRTNSPTPCPTPSCASEISLTPFERKINLIKEKYHRKKNSFQYYLDRVELKLFGERDPFMLAQAAGQKKNEPVKKDDDDYMDYGDLNPREVMINRANDNVFYQSNVDLDTIDIILGYKPLDKNMKLNSVPPYVPTAKQKKLAAKDAKKDKQNKIVIV
ncbi:hypothetical protein TRICI_003258 [Trichomonascus ciferrii]|uniref:Uncharacterized protein n=1 Tax=Trichomonascus ciferrii TaxID=44093 RepID=A0A642V9H7_9ASCO|nr:hypothetical protein TRICI_003258 [Trichomonascus ciferrii]